MSQVLVQFWITSVTDGRTDIPVGKSRLLRRAAKN